MKRFIAILIGCSLALANGAQAAQQDAKKKQKSKPVQQQQVAPKQRMMPKTNVQSPRTQHVPNVNSAKVYNRNVPKQQLHNVPAVQSNKYPAVRTNKLPAVQTNQLPAVQKNKPPVVRSDKLPPVQPNRLPAVQTNKLPAVQANKRTVQTFQSRHTNFHARPNTAIVSATFNQNFRIRGSENWSGYHYNAFRTYRPQWHDRGWWHSHHNHIVLIGGGWYFWNAGYWFPAWGYDPGVAYYPYDGPIYVGSNPRPFDQVVADVQSVLQEQGYYRGEVDGLVGPLTQEALAEYQRAQGLESTAAIDQPTLESLGIG